MDRKKEQKGGNREGLTEKAGRGHVAQLECIYCVHLSVCAVISIKERRNRRIRKNEHLFRGSRGRPLGTP